MFASSNGIRRVIPLGTVLFLSYVPLFERITVLCLLAAAYSLASSISSKVLPTAVKSAAELLTNLGITVQSLFNESEQDASVDMLLIVSALYQPIKM